MTMVMTWQRGGGAYAFIFESTNCVRNVFVGNITDNLNAMRTLHLERWFFINLHRNNVHKYIYHRTVLARSDSANSSNKMYVSTFSNKENFDRENICLN